MRDRHRGQHRSHHLGAIQRWIPLAGLTFFGSCIVVAWTVQWLATWMPWIIGGGLVAGAAWMVWHFRGVIVAIRSSWNEPASAPNPPVIDTILPKGT